MPYGPKIRQFKNAFFKFEFEAASKGDIVVNYFLSETVEDLGHLEKSLHATLKSFSANYLKDFVIGMSLSQ